MYFKSLTVIVKGSAQALASSGGVAVSRTVLKVRKSIRSEQTSPAHLAIVKVNEEVSEAVKVEGKFGD